jgi:hypothetical protein
VILFLQRGGDLRQIPAPDFLRNFYLTLHASRHGKRIKFEKEQRKHQGNAIQILEEST